MYSDEEDYSDGRLYPTAEPHTSAAPTAPVIQIQSPLIGNADGLENENDRRFDMHWVNTLHRTILNEVRTHGIEACLWSSILEKWQSFLADVPFEDVEFGCIRAILQHARLTPNAQPTFYETLRKLGKDILYKENIEENVRRSLLDRLLSPGPGDTEIYAQYFGEREKWYEENSKSLINHLDKLHALYGSTLTQELNKEKVLGFIVPHIRSNRYHPVELAAILRHLLRGVDETKSERLRSLAARLDADDQPSTEDVAEAQTFILRCFENIYRARQSLDGAEKRSGAVGVILFTDMSNDTEMQRSNLDQWYDRTMEQAGQTAAGQNPLERSTLKEVRQLIDSEKVLWEEWKSRLTEGRKGRDFKIGQQPLFSVLNKLHSPSLPSQVMNSIKTYCEKKKNLRDLARKSSLLHCVIQAIEDTGADLQQAVVAAAPRGGRVIAVFGYAVNSEGKGVPEASEQSVIVRSVPLTRKHGLGEEAGASEELDARVFEIGVNLAGTYLAFEPRDGDELLDMLKTSGLGLGRDDRVHFFMFLAPGQHSPRSKPVEELLRPLSEEGVEFTHALLTIPDSPSRQSYTEISDAGGRFLIDLKRVGSVKTEGMRYQPLAVEAAASVAVGEDGRVRAFRRLAVLLPPSMPNEMPLGYKLGRLAQDADRGEGFQESAEIVAEVLSLVAIDKSKMDDNADSAKCGPRSSFRPII